MTNLFIIAMNVCRNSRPVWHGGVFFSLFRCYHAHRWFCHFGPAGRRMYGTNAGIRYDNAKAVVFGPGSIEQAHQADEWVSLEQLHLHKRVLRQWLYGED